ncbi:GATA transcription factor 26-like isoform X2 [Magnolia sinica]|uniref:GATA transcription factor 26-like isoform X2 n=1 Tax=Magnolia sinica TaxID=86752 RepID=UPI00265AB85B|nr:GATA transcription factor 26-like isoform X2 [Magnolia sinica]XP_058089674.1 GATA transcription factor 26-like isoform X2 [Magnolia sinica]XP_058089675.1 GATA transcription factor 26-like isoform X2 [Magnolia sinica]
MRKQGPCCHCGITSTPLWRNGPPCKPVLCNACGSRWRTKGTLENYVPLHSVRFAPIDSEDSRNSQEPKISSKRKLKTLHKVNRSEGEIEVGEMIPGQYLHKTVFEDDTSNRSSSGSAISFSESCVQLESMDGNDISGSAQSCFWDSHIPSRKMKGIECHSPSPVEKLRRDLYGILQEQESSYLSGSSEEVLLFERHDPMVPVETCLGSVLIKRPLSSEEEEWEASSLMKENKISCLNDACMSSSFIQASSQSSEVSSNPGVKYRMIQNFGEKEEINEQPAKRRALTNRSSNLDIQRNMAAPKDHVKNENHVSANFHLLRESSIADRASVSKPPKDQLRLVRLHSSMNLSALSPGSNSIMLKSTSDNPFNEDSLSLCPSASGPLQVLETKRQSR